MPSLTYVLSLSTSVDVCELAANALQAITPHAITMISGPKVAMVQLRVREGVADTVFNAGEILVTETRLEVNGQFGFGMIVGNQPEFATALAVIDAVMHIPGEHHTLITTRVTELAQVLQQQQHRQFAASNSTKVEFDVV